jgi:hypothetical protein
VDAELQEAEGRTNERGGTMRRVIINEQLTLDGVMQGPGAPDEDRSGGFEHGG